MKTYIFYDNRFAAGTREIGRHVIAANTLNETYILYREAELISGEDGIPMDEIYWELETYD